MSVRFSKCIIFQIKQKGKFMLNRFIDNLEYSSRFRILKGGKISLVVSALLLATTANAYNITISDSPTTCAGAIGGVITAVADCNILASDVTSALGSGNLEINTGGDGNISFASDVSWSTNRLTLTSTNGLVLFDINEAKTDFIGKANISSSGGLTINGEVYTIITDQTGLSNISYSGKSALANDITLTGNWTSKSLGNNAKFNGLGHSISDMTINDTSSNGYMKGLFGQPLAVHIGNVNLKNVNIQANRQAGALIGELRGDPAATTYVYNNISSGTITLTASTGIGGGLIAQVVSNYTTGGEIYLLNNHSSVNVTAQTGTDVGGLYGWLGWGDITIDGGSSTATLSSAPASATYNGIGGIIGRLESNPNNTVSISNLNFSGTINSVGNTDRTGGIIGIVRPSNNNAANVTVALNNLQSNATINSDSYVGGIVGQILTNVDTYLLTLDNSKFSGSINVGDAKQYIGGIIGRSYALATTYPTISNSTFSGTITAGASSTYVGGIIGSKQANLQNSSITKLPTVNGITPTLDDGIASDFFGRFSGFSGAGIDSGNVLITLSDQFSAEVTTSSPMLNINSTHGGAGDWDGYIFLGDNPSCGIAEGKHYYQTQTFIAVQDANHTVNTASLDGFLTETSGGWVNDNFMAVYQGVFDPSNPTANLVGCNDDIDYDNNNLKARFSADLNSNQVYTMVFTSSMSPEYIEATYEYANPENSIKGSGTFTITPEVSLAYSVGGTVSGLENGETLTLSGVGSTDTVISANGSFIFDTPLANSADYNITATLSGTSNQFRSCVVSNGSGAINSANVNNISVSCVEDTNNAPIFGIGSGKAIVSIPDGLNHSLVSSKYQATTDKYIAITSEGIVRINKDATLDTTFGTNGKVLFTTNIASSLDVDSLGRILLSETISKPSWALINDFTVRRLNADGSIDTTFGTNGTFTHTTTSINDTAYDVKVLKDDSLILLGKTQNSTNNTHPYEASLIKVTSAGTLDTTFATSGKLIIPTVNNYAEGFVYSTLDSQGNIYALGRSNNYIIVSKVTPLGTLDTSFGTNGVQRLVLQNALSTIGNSITLQSDGKILLNGFLNETTPSNTKSAVIRLNINGSLDTTFGADGVVKLDKFPNQQEAGSQQF
jgi:uncharacterized delta-60 repeat protein